MTEANDQGNAGSQIDTDNHDAVSTQPDPSTADSSDAADWNKQPTTYEQVTSWMYFLGILGGIALVLVVLWKVFIPPPAPLTCSFREALLTTGYVLQVRNTSDRMLSCRGVFTSETHNQQAKYAFRLRPQSMQEIGSLECGWTFLSGEKVQIFTEGHRDVYFIVP